VTVGLVLGLAGVLPVGPWAGPVLGAEKPAPEDLAFVARADGSTERFVLLLPAEFDARQSHDLLIVLHGHGSDRWQYVRDPRDECRVARDVAAERRMIFVSPDYRAKTSWMGKKAEADLVQILELVKKFVLRRAASGGASRPSASRRPPDGTSPTSRPASSPAPPDTACPAGPAIRPCGRRPGD